MGSDELDEKAWDVGAWSVFLIFLRLGCTSFGGPIAHLSYFHQEFVARRKWLSERSYADLVALCQFLPGPASSQVGMALGLYRSGYSGALAAWLGFTLPSAILLILFALGIANYGDVIPTGMLHGLKIVTVAVVAQAVWSMAQKLCLDLLRWLIMIAAAAIALLIPSTAGQITAITIAGLIGVAVIKSTRAASNELLPPAISRRAGVICLILFFTLLFGLPSFAQRLGHQTVILVDAFYRSGSLVFGGGHVVLPLLQAEVVRTGWVSNEAFLAGYGAAQAIPGPLFAFAAYLGASMNLAPTGWIGGLICLFSIFAPSMLLVVGALPFWDQLRQYPHMQAALAGVNAAVVGLLLAALYQPVWTSAIYSPRDFGLALAALFALMYWKLPPWLVVLLSGIGGWLLHLAV